LPKDSVGFAVSSQLVRSGTSVGANIEEAQNSPSRKDFVRGMTIALKECREANYWLKLVREAGLLKSTELDNLISESVEITRILTASVKKAKIGL